MSKLQLIQATLASVWPFEPASVQLVMLVSALVNRQRTNENPLLGEMEDLPKAGDTNVALSNLRKRDGSRVDYLDSDAEHFIFPWHRIAFIEVMPSEAERAKVMKFFRE